MRVKSFANAQGLLTFTLVSIAVLISIRNFPSMALVG
jgi:cbb3-type cytochrome oxidase subunit 3